jgi:hypothetical protein
VPTLPSMYGRIVVHVEEDQDAARREGVGVVKFNYYDMERVQNVRKCYVVMSCKTAVKSMIS